MAGRLLIANVPLAATWTRKGRSGIPVSLEAPTPRRLKGAAMLHRHLTMEERIGIAVFMRMGMSCRKIAAYPGRGHTTIFRKLRRSRSKAAILLNGRHAQKSKRCRAMTMYEPLRTDLIAYLDEKLCRDCSPEQMWGEFRSGQGKRGFSWAH